MRGFVVEKRWSIVWVISSRLLSPTQYRLRLVPYPSAMPMASAIPADKYFAMFLNIVFSVTLFKVNGNGRLIKVSVDP